MAIAGGEQIATHDKERARQYRQENLLFLETILIVLFNVLLKTDDEL